MSKESNKQTSIFAAGCFWGVQYLMQKAPGVIGARAGYSGGCVADPSYKQVCAGNTGHLEVVEITFDLSRTTYEALVKLFFEIHDFTQQNGQGPDIGQQYLSAIFYKDEAQKQTAQEIISALQSKGYKVATKLLPAAPFYPAEDYHQDYYEKKGTLPYCHARKKIF